MDDQIEQFALTAPAEQRVAKRVKPTLIEMGARGLVPSDGRWHPELCAEYIRDHGGRDRWIPIGDLSRRFFGGNTPSNRKRTRQRLCQVWRRLLQDDLLLVIEMGPRMMALSCKIFNPRSAEERKYLQIRLEHMQSQRLIKSAQLQRAIALVECLELQVAEP